MANEFYANSTVSSLAAAQLGQQARMYANQNMSQFVPGTKIETPKTKGLMKTIIDDIKNFIKEHRAIIYGVLLVLLVDHFFLGGKLKKRVRLMAEKLFGTIERKVDAITHADPAIKP